MERRFFRVAPLNMTDEIWAKIFPQPKPVEKKPVIADSLEEGVGIADRMISERLKDAKKPLIVEVVGGPGHGKTEFSRMFRDREKTYSFGYTQNPENIRSLSDIKADVFFVHCIHEVEVKEKIRQHARKNPDLTILIMVSDENTLYHRRYPNEPKISVIKAIRQSIASSQRFIKENKPDLVVNNNKTYQV